MRIPDPFAPLAGGSSHRADIAIAEAVTGVPGRSISRHLVEPVVKAGVGAGTAVALLHWLILAVCVFVLTVGFALVASAKMQTERS